MPVQNFLTLDQVEKLQSALRESELPHVRERILILLLQNDGKTQQEIGQFLGVLLVQLLIGVCMVTQII